MEQKASLVGQKTAKKFGRVKEKTGEWKRVGFTGVEGRETLEVKDDDGSEYWVSYKEIGESFPTRLKLFCESEPLDIAEGT